MSQPLTKAEIRGTALSTAMEIVHNSPVACELIEYPIDRNQDVVNILTEIISGIWEAAILNGSSLGLRTPETAKKLVDETPTGAIESGVEV